MKYITLVTCVLALLWALTMARPISGDEEVKDLQLRAVAPLPQKGPMDRYHPGVTPVHIQDLKPTTTLKNGGVIYNYDNIFDAIQYGVLLSVRIAVGIRTLIETGAPTLTDARDRTILIVKSPAVQWQGVQWRRTGCRPRGVHARRRGKWRWMAKGAAMRWPHAQRCSGSKTLRPRRTYHVISAPSGVRVGGRWLEARM